MTEMALAEAPGPAARWEERQERLPGLDGLVADVWTLAFGGSVELVEQTDGDLDLLEKLRLYGSVRLSVEATVVGKAFGGTEKADGERQTTHRVALRVHSIIED